MYLDEQTRKPMRILFAFMVIALISCLPTYEANMQNYNHNPDLSKIKYSSNSGDSAKDAIIILNANKSNVGIAAEYAYLSKNYGEKNKDWKLIKQSSYSDKVSGKTFDVLDIEILDKNQTKTVFFDISNFYGKW